ncbi:TetR/AcrR family transcriptional regulator [Leucobacter iarius]
MSTRSPAREAMIEAMTELLMSGKAASELSITEFVASVGVSRPTFYAHFQDVPAVARQAALTRMKHTFAKIPAAAVGDSWQSFARGTFTTLLTDLVRDARFYLTAWESAETLLTADIVGFLANRLLDESPLGPIIRRRAGADTPQQRAEFLAAGTIWQVRAWLTSGTATEDTVDAFNDQLATLLFSSSGATPEEIAATGMGAPADTE